MGSHASYHALIPLAKAKNTKMEERERTQPHASWELSKTPNGQRNPREREREREHEKIPKSNTKKKRLIGFLQIFLLTKLPLENYITKVHLHAWFQLALL